MKHVLIAAAVLTVVFMTISCATGVSAEEFQAYQVQQEQAIGELEERIERLSELSGRIDTLSQSINEMQSSIETLAGTTASRKDVDAFEKRLGELTREFSAFSGALTDLAHNAGYDSSEEFLELAQDIVDVNKNISSLNVKLEKLRTAMALFVE